MGTLPYARKDNEHTFTFRIVTGKGEVEDTVERDHMWPQRKQKEQELGGSVEKDSFRQEIRHIF